MLYKKKVDSCNKFKSVDELSAKLKKLIIVCRENFYHTQKLQKQANNKGIKPRSYVLGDKVWLNSKYIKTKQNQKLKIKFFGLFWVLHPIEKQAYKLKLSKKWKIYNIFYISLLEQNTTKKGWVDKNVKQIEFDVGNCKKYKVKAIWNSAI